MRPMVTIEQDLMDMGENDLNLKICRSYSMISRLAAEPRITTLLKKSVYVVILGRSLLVLTT